MEGLEQGGGKANREDHNRDTASLSAAPVTSVANADQSHGNGQSMAVSTANNIKESSSEGSGSESSDRESRFAKKRKMSQKKLDRSKLRKGKWTVRFVRS